MWAALFGIVSIACSSAYLLSLSLSGKGEEISCHLSMFQPKVSYSLYTALLYNILHRSRPGPYLRYAGIINNISDATHSVHYNIYSRYYLVCPFLDRHIHIFRCTWTLLVFFFLLRNIIGLGYLSSLNNSAHADDIM